MPSFSRLLKPSDLPVSLWDASSQYLSIPPLLAQAYVQVIRKNDLLSLLEEGEQGGSPVGGMSADAAADHFARRFSGSVARAQLAILDPKGDVTAASDSFIRLLAGSKICLTYVPCGAGATAFTFLSAIAELRARGVLPRQPLDVYLIAGELSDHAKRYAMELLDELMGPLAEEGIFLKAEFVEWNVLEPFSNTRLIQRMTLMSGEYPRKMLVVANFSGLLQRESKFKAAREQIDELFRHASGGSSTAVWIEPQMNIVTDEGKLFDRLVAVFTGLPQFLKLLTDPGKRFLGSDAKYQLPLRPSSFSWARLAIVALDLGGN